jgi:hypothetical protein
MGLLNGTFFLGRSQFRACSAPRDASRSECPLPTSQHNSCRSCWFINEFSTRCLTAVLPSGTIRYLQRICGCKTFPVQRHVAAPKMWRQGCFPLFTFLTASLIDFIFPMILRWTIRCVTGNNVFSQNAMRSLHSESELYAKLVLLTFLIYEDVE